METQKDYVIRKLKSDFFNHTAIADALNINRDTLYRIEKGITKNPSSRTIEVLYKHFKESGD
ncbi:hypothetical protein PIGBHMHK_00671 [Mycoplasmopsis arginini]|uniref:hypothetical protein n=1 Tax=Mycoplasmopsis arginini TaxID=2094 RepID=UPI00249F1D9B|nr:hypothetical protein [Mycoplasmopsis arginini]MDI3349233.1 hypothetical protein [Mycoplasmopsis arginini]